MIRQLLAAPLLWLSLSPCQAQEPAGVRPTYSAQPPSRVVNEAAMVQKLWAPGINEGLVPQGVALAGDTVLVSGYRSTDPKQDKGPCVVHAISRINAAVVGQFSLPQDCGHAGGLAMGDGDTLYVSDTRRLYIVKLKEALAGQATIKTIKLAGELKGSFAAWEKASASLWLGTYDKDSAARMHRIDASLLATWDSATALREDSAAQTAAIPARSQGAAFAADGTLWTSQSSSKFGQISKLDTKTGAVLARFDAPIGIEDLEFDDQGRLWSVSEAGAQKYLSWSAFFPIVFAIDTTKLK
jgi:hypothetical protein